MGQGRESPGSFDFLGGEYNLTLASGDVSSSHSFNA